MAVIRNIRNIRRYWFSNLSSYWARSKALARVMAGASDFCTITGRNPRASIIFNALEYWPTSALAASSPRRVRNMSPIIT